MATNGKPGPKKASVAGMEKLSLMVSLYRPPPPATANGALETNGNAGRPDPKMVLVFAWMGAQDVHIAKYITKYQDLYPAAQILVVKSVPNHFIFWKAGPRDLEPAIPVLRAAFPGKEQTGTAEQPELLIHLFSNGGSYNLRLLYDAYRASAEADGESGSLPTHVTVFDSAPGITRYWFAWRAFTAGFGWLLKLLIGPLIHGFFLFVLLQRILIGGVDTLAAIGNVHNMPNRNDTELRRVYLYSNADRLVLDEDIEQHAAEAKLAGYKVRLEKFDGTAHVTHARKYPDRYWQLVQDLWLDKLSS